MLFVKAKINEEIEIKVPLYSDQIYSNCPVCGKETEIDEGVLHSILEEDGDFSSTSVYCDPCSDKYQESLRPEVEPE
jgi:hypothetical protein